MAVALTLLVLVAAALITAAQLVRDDAGRTLEERRGAQLRALLLAGRDLAVAELQAGRDFRNNDIALPAALEGAKLTIDARRIGDAIIIDVSANVDGQTSGSQFKATKLGDGRLAITDAILGR